MHSRSRLSEARYKAGIESYLSVLVAQGLVYSAQQGLISLHTARLGNLSDGRKEGRMVESNEANEIPPGHTSAFCDGCGQPAALANRGAAC